jgi:hypothetical protein
MVMLMFQVFVAVLAAAAAIEIALLLKRACQRWRVAPDSQNTTLAIDAAHITAPDPAPGSEPQRVEP